MRRTSLWREALRDFSACSFHAEQPLGVTPHEKNVQRNICGEPTVLFHGK